MQMQVLLQRARLQAFRYSSGYKYPPSPALVGNLAMQKRLQGYDASRPDDPLESSANSIAERLINRGSIEQAAGPGDSQDSRSWEQLAGGASDGSELFAGSGKPLPEGDRQFFESRFNADFSSVRIHDDPPTHAAADQLNARAFTHGTHIGFNRDQFRPDGHEGQKLLAHELAHVSQNFVTHDTHTIHRETWNVNDSKREIERDLLVQLNFHDTWTDMIQGTGWTAARKIRFRNEFVSSIETTFNNSGFVVTPPASYGDVLPTTNVEQGYKPVVDINLVPDGEWSWAEDWEVDVSSNPTGEFRTSSSSTVYGTLDEADNTPITKASSGPGVTQAPTTHEFGHFIGLDHPGEGLIDANWTHSEQPSWWPDPLSPGADEYSHTGTDAQGRTVHGPSDLMGGGMGLRAFYFDAWAKALDEHVADLRRAEQQRQFQRDWGMFRRALSNDPAGVQWLMRGMSGM